MATGTGDGGSDRFQQRIGGVLAIGALVIVGIKVLLAGTLLPSDGVEQLLGALTALLAAAAGFFLRGRVESPARADELVEKQRLLAEKASLERQLEEEKAKSNPVPPVAPVPPMVRP